MVARISLSFPLFWFGKNERYRDNVLCPFIVEIINWFSWYHMSSTIGRRYHMMMRMLDYWSGTQTIFPLFDVWWKPPLLLLLLPLLLMISIQKKILCQSTTFAFHLILQWFVRPFFLSAISIPDSYVLLWAWQEGFRLDHQQQPKGKWACHRNHIQSEWANSTNSQVE